MIFDSLAKLGIPPLNRTQIKANRSFVAGVVKQVNCVGQKKVYRSLQFMCVLDRVVIIIHFRHNSGNSRQFSIVSLQLLLQVPSRTRYCGLYKTCIPLCYCMYCYIFCIAKLHTVGAKKSTFCCVER